MFLKILPKVGSLLGLKRSNTIANNLQQWTEWDWSEKGEEWSNQSGWKESLVAHVLLPNIPRDSVVLEIGPGGGRWTEVLLSRVKKLTVVDLTQKCIDVCKDRFRDRNNIDFFVNDGRTLGMIESASVERIWSWDVFVHIAASDIRSYVAEFARVLVPGGRAIIHHSKNGENKLGWRSDMTAEKMVEYCTENGLVVISQFDRWDNGRVLIWPDYPADLGLDTISIIEKPVDALS
jgi:SAM-dependent methyltransferase